jgi:hypothetical protein
MPVTAWIRRRGDGADAGVALPQGGVGRGDEVGENCAEGTLGECSLVASR